MIIVFGTPSMAKGSTQTDICIIGAGPHGLAAAVHLRQADPNLIITTIDRRPSWLTTWSEQFARAEIKTLRSPAVHHPAPDPYALPDFIRSQGLAQSGLPYNLPTTCAFEQFCRFLIDHYDLEPPLATPPWQITSRGRELRIECSDHIISARNVIVATNPHRRNIPAWIEPLLGQRAGLIASGYDVDLRALPGLDGDRVVVVGGGLTAAHLALGAASRGATVQLISRENLRVRDFDTAPGWLGPKYLNFFHAELDPARRLAIASKALAGGSMPNWVHQRLMDISGAGQIDLRESTVVRRATLSPDKTGLLELSDGLTVPADRVWLATGTRTDANAIRSLRPLLDDVDSIGGLPIVDTNLRLGPHRAFVMGRLTTLSLGPASGNLWGAQRAAQRITQCITGVDLECTGIETTATPAPRP